MAVVASIMRKENLFIWEQVALAVGATQVLPTTVLPATAQIQGVKFTNDDTAITMYLGLDNTVSTTKFSVQILPGKYFEDLMSASYANKLYAVAASGTPNLSVEVFS